MISKEKMNKKERKRLEAEARNLWRVKPITKVKESKKKYKREKRFDDEC